MHVVRTKLMAQDNRLPTLAESMSFLHVVEQLFPHTAYFPTLQMEEAGYSKM